MNKVVKRILKIVGIAIAVIVVVLIGYIIYLYASIIALKTIRN